MDSVATNKQKNISTNISSNNDINISSDTNNLKNTSIKSNSIEEIINEIVTNKEKAITKKRQIAIYLDEDVARAFDKYAKKNGKGAKSELIEKLLQSTLHKAGYLKD